MSENELLPLDRLFGQLVRHARQSKIEKNAGTLKFMLEMISGLKKALESSLEKVEKAEAPR
jgi:hypothetical protein